MFDVLFLVICFFLDIVGKILLVFFKEYLEIVVKNFVKLVMVMVKVFV